MLKKKNKKNKAKILGTNMKNILQKEQKPEIYNSIKTNEYIIKDIVPDGNCFYRALSYYYRDSQNHHLEFRELLHNIYGN